MFTPRRRRRQCRRAAFAANCFRPENRRAKVRLCLQSFWRYTVRRRTREIVVRGCLGTPRSPVSPRVVVASMHPAVDGPGVWRPDSPPLLDDLRPGCTLAVPARRADGRLVSDTVETSRMWPERDAAPALYSVLLTSQPFVQLA